MSIMSILVFFFQAEDGIRDRNVTGVQTCALPISRSRARHPVDQLLLPHPPDRRAGQSHRPRIRSPLTPWGARQLGSTIALRGRSEEHTSELQSRFDIVCRLLLEKKKHHTISSKFT